MTDSSGSSAPDGSLQALSTILDEIQDLTLSRHESSNALALPTIADPQKIAHGIATLSAELPEQGWGLEKAGRYLLDEVAPTLAAGQAGSRYFGFVTGGVLPAAAIADNLVTLYDPNVSVHLPSETLSTLIEDHTITLLLQLLSLPREQFTGTLTTGATSANILSLACAREEVIERTVRRTRGLEEYSLAQEGFGEDTPAVNVFVTRPHASIQKAAALVGIGRKRVIDVGGKPSFSNGEFDFTSKADIEQGVKVLDFDLTALESHLSKSYTNGQGSIVVVGMGEVNTGALTNQLPALRQLCNKYDAWLHVDAAFSAFVGLLEGYEWICEHMARCADSITSDAHKQLNVPYDAGLMFIRKKVLDAESHDSLLQDVCGPGKGQQTPAYLKAPTVDFGGADDADDNDSAREIRRKHTYALSVPSPLCKNIENSKRLRALPVYAALLSEGRQGIKSIVQRNVSFRRAIETWMRGEGSKWYQVLTPSPSSPHSTEKPWSSSDWNSTILMFRPREQDTTEFIAAVKATRKIYISPTAWHGIPAARLAVSNWRTGLEAADGTLVDSVEDSEDYRVTIEVLTQVMQTRV